jgi:hypothetical protein
MDGQELNIIGVSVPVWVYQGKTSEPAHEIFCKYKITPDEYKMILKQVDLTYEIVLPKESFNPEDKKENPISLKNLLDLKDGGVEWLAFRQFGKIKRKNKKTISVVHFVEIKPIEELNLIMI